MSDSGSSRRPLMVGLLLSVFLIAFQTMGILAALPTVMRALEAGQLYPWAMTVFSVGMLAAVMTAGQVTDRIGPLRPMITGIALFFAGLIFSGLAPNVWVFLLSRAVMGLGAGAMNLSLFVVVALAFRGAERANVMTWFSFMWLLPAFVGPPVAGYLVGISWRLVFGITLPLLVVAVLLILPSLRALQSGLDLSDAPRNRFPGATVALLASAPVGLQLAGQGFGIWSLVAGVVGALCLVVGLPRMLPPGAVMTQPGLGPVIASRALAAGAFFTCEAYVILGLQNLKGLSEVQAGFALTIGSVGWSIGSWLQSRAWVRLRRDQLITAGAACLMVGLLAVAVFMSSATSMVLGGFGWTLAGLGMGFMMASTAVATMSLSTPTEQGRNNSALQVTEVLGQAVLAALAGALYATLLQPEQPVPTFTTVLMFLAVMAGVAVFMSIRIGPVVNESARARR